MHPALLRTQQSREDHNTRANGFCSCICIRPQNQGMDISELELVQITIILLMMTFIIAVLVCLLSHYWLPALTFLSRMSHAHRDQATQMVMCGHLNNSVPPFMQQDIINLPPIICLSDGEELLPHKGPCTLQLQLSEQQLELRRSTVHAPPNKTVFDTPSTEFYIHSKTLQSSSSNCGPMTFNARVETPPPSYSALMRDCPDSTSCYWQNGNNTSSRSGCAVSKTTFHTGSSGPDSTTQAFTDLHS